jgi:hypothetical protein
MVVVTNSIGAGRIERLQCAANERCPAAPIAPVKPLSAIASVAVVRALHLVPRGRHGEVAGQRFTADTEMQCLTRLRELCAVHSSTEVSCAT